MLFWHCFRKLGTSKRFSEQEKRDVAELLSTKLETSREEWSLETKRLKDQLEKSKEENRQKRQLFNSVYKEVLEFTKVHGPRLETHAHELTTTTDIVQRLQNHPELYDQLGDEIDKLFQKISGVIGHRDSLYYERDKCLRLVSKTDRVDEKSVSLHCVLAQEHSTAPGRASENWIREAEEKDALMRRLVADVEDLERYSEECRDSLNQIQQDLFDNEIEIDSLRNQL